MNLLTGARERIATLEAAAADALAPAVELRLDGWRLRFDRAPARRVRSVLPEARGTRPVAEKLRRVEAFYAERGAAARVQLSPVALPTGLDAALDERGWVREEGALVLARDLTDLGDLDGAAPEGATGAPDREADGEAVRIGDAGAEAALFAVVEEVAPDAAAWTRARTEALRNLKRAARAVALVRDGTPVAAGLCVHEPAARAVGLFQAAVVPAYRGCGASGRLLRAMLRDGRALGARTAYLQVGADNDRALRSYRSARFTEHHRYHYRRAPDAPTDGRAPRA